MTFTSFVAVGDSFTEGMSDELPGGGYRGWADLVAARLTAAEPGLRYANLAVRGKLVAQILAEQVDTAAAMRADLVSYAGGLNDVLRPRCELALLSARIEKSVGVLAESGATLVLFRPPDPSRRMRGGSRILPRIHVLLRLIERLAERHDARVVDLFTHRVFDDPRLWADDRLHLNTEGHRRVAEAVLAELVGAGDLDWTAALPPAPPRAWLDRRRSDARWARVHLGPWIGRRLTGRSSGDGREPKRPELGPFGG